MLTAKTAFNNCAIKTDLALRDRVFKRSCGFEADRDLNAAINIHLVGASTLLGEAVRRFEAFAA